MRIAVLGDVHGNIEALDRVLAEADRRGCERCFHTGDLVGYGPRPNETVDRIAAGRIAGVRGNFDESAAWDGDSPGSKGDSRGRDLAERTFRWTVANLGFRQKNYLKDVPFSIDTELGGRRVAFFHASPDDLYTPIDEASTDAALAALASETGADIHLFGHTHRPFHRTVEGKHFINAGSVGFPGDRDPRACLAVITIGGRVEVEFVRVTYDYETAAKDAEAAGLPEAIARRIRTGS